MADALPDKDADCDARAPAQAGAAVRVRKGAAAGGPDAAADEPFRDGPRLIGRSERVLDLARPLFAVGTGLLSGLIIAKEIRPDGAEPVGRDAASARRAPNPSAPAAEAVA